MMTETPRSDHLPADLARWLNEDSLRTLETLLGRALARLELYELRKEDVLSIAGAFGLPFSMRLDAGKRLQHLTKQSETARDEVRELRTKVDGLRRRLGLYRAPLPVEQPVSPERERAARAVSRDILLLVERELSAKADGRPAPAEAAKLQNEARQHDAAETEVDDDLDWGS